MVIIVAVIVIVKRAWMDVVGDRVVCWCML
jgi:hypothetical protein